MTATILKPTVTASGLLVQMPSGDACFYVGDEATSEQMRHSYWRANWGRKRKKDPEGWMRGTRLTGVTTATKALDIDPKHLLKWAARTNGIGIALLAGPVVRSLMANEGNVAPDELAWLCSHETIWDTLIEHTLTYDDVRDAKAVIGTNVHERAFQALAMGKPVPELDRLTEEERGYAKGVMAFWLDHSPAAEQVEQILVDLEMGVAGRVDFRGALEAVCGDPTCPCHTYEGTGVVDAKTGNYLGPSAHAQVGGYRGLSATAGFGETNWGALLKLRADGTYALVNAEADPLDFATAVGAYRTAGRIDREANKTRKARVQQAKEAANA